MNNDGIAAIPFLGSGLGYRRELKAEIFKSRDSIDFLEIITDQFIQNFNTTGELEEICEVFPVIPHGIGLSIGSISPIDQNYLQAIKRISDTTRSPYYSEHLCITRVPGIDIRHLSPLWFTEEVLENAINNVCQVQDYLSKPLVLENITYLFDIPGGDMKQTEFFNRLVEKTGCGILLDITNIFINSVNHDFDPITLFKEMPLDKVIQVHLAGGFWKDNILIDSHSESVHEESWNLLTVLSAMINIKGIIIEHDSNFPHQISVLLEQVDRARKIGRC